MTIIQKTYNPKEVENKWYSHWLEQDFFSSKPDKDKQPYTIVIPPPNVTGVLHMGHMLNNTIQDILIRKARMEGKEACWVPGTDHASIATEARVVAMLKEKGINKSDLSREQFLQHAWEWKDKYGGIILDQLKKMGASCDWKRTKFTMDPNLSEAVIDVFIKLYKKGLIYKGYRMVNWDPQGKTAVSDEEVIHKEVQSKLFYLKYKVVGNDEYISVATTRPETIFGDTAICFNPVDPRYNHLKGKKLVVPIVNREVPVIYDDYIDIAFGTGALKVTPAHDINDYNIGIKHNLEIIDVFTEDGKLIALAGSYAGLDRFVVRKKIAKDLAELGLLEKTEDITNKIGFSERTDAIIEPRLSSQWFVDMKKFLDKNPEVLSAVLQDEINIYPPKFKNTYRHWLENIKDWCISRQLWWGQQIPAYYMPDGNFVIAKNIEEAQSEALHKYGITLQPSDFRQDEDVLDTWFSSWLWPISVFDGIKNPENEDIKYYYPTNDLVTAPEILFFWVARMIMAGFEFKGKKPFTNVYLTGIVRDKSGKKMSKSLGNSPDPFELIEKFSADGVRVGMLLSSPAGNDLLFDEKLCEQGRNFCNKIWNAFRLIKGWTITNDTTSQPNKVAIEWFETKLNAALLDIEDNFSKYRLSEALRTLYLLVWDDFCSWYLEMVKPGFELPIDAHTYNQTILFFEKLIKIIHPFMPFISEELWHELKIRESRDCVIVASWPIAGTVNNLLIEEAAIAIEVITNIRNIRNAKQLPKHHTFELFIKSEKPDVYQKFDKIITKLAVVSDIKFTHQKIDNCAGFVVQGDEFFVPLQIEIDVEKEKENIIKEINYTEGFLNSVEKKLSNERFTSSAPLEVVEIEKQKKQDAITKLKTLKESLSKM